MTKRAAMRLKISMAIVLSAVLVSCSAESPDTASTASQKPPAKSGNAETPTPGSDRSDASDPSGPASSTWSPASSPAPSASNAGKENTTNSEHNDPSDAVEASKLEPSPPKAGSSKEAAFNFKSPSLANIKLGDTDDVIIKKYGLPVESYPLPGDEGTIDIWEYDGLSIGLDETSAVVYIEVNADKAKTGILGLKLGMEGSDAAKLLGIPVDGMSNVLTAKVTGGWVKLDLDPDTRAVLTIRLLSLDE
ncbi:hypothetical protein [Cohnella soli]|uniref:Uncharacterized protein n=1 Tax=Cohnella soli TaxID=425005 RepID=A0ABW0HZG4_9BACL